MRIKGVIAQVEKNIDEWVKVRLILLQYNFSFNNQLRALRLMRDRHTREKDLIQLAERLQLSPKQISYYLANRKFFLRDIEYDQSVYYVAPDTEGKMSVIDQEGIYIRFYPDQTDEYYSKIIKQLRADHAFLQSSEEEKRQFLDTHHRTAIHFLDNKKAPKFRHQHGSNFLQDIEIYLTCEKAIQDMFNTETDPVKVVDKEKEGIKRIDEEKYISDAIDLTAEELKIAPQQAKRMYYEVCRRYKLPTLTSNPF